MVTFKEFFSFKHNCFFWLNLIAMVAVVIGSVVGTLYWLDCYTLHGQAIVVPNVKGLELAAARNELTKRSLRIAIADSSYVKGVPAGAVLEQNPAGGFHVKEGRTVFLTINTGSAPLVAVPDVMDNSSLRQAVAKLRALGFKLAAPEYISGERDWVYSVKYRGRELRAGEKIPHEVVLTLRVGNGSDALPADSLLEQSLDGTADDDRPVVDESWF